MKEKSEFKIFLAHAHEDKVRVIDLYNKLAKEGYSPWLDKKDLMPGQQWKIEIPKVLKKSDIFIACLSKTSVQKQGYVQSEFKLALRQAADMPAEAIYIIPLKLDECRIPELEQADYGVKLRDIQWLDYWEEGAFERLVAAIEYRRSELEVLNKERRQEKKSNIAQSDQAVEKQEETSERKLSTFSFEVVKVNRTGEIIKRETCSARYFSEDLGDGVSLAMVYIPEGEFWMGTEDEEIERLVKKYEVDYFRWEKPRHKVTVPSFYMGKYPITQAQWKAIASLPKIDRDLDPEPSGFKGENRPVEFVNWYDVVEYCKRLSKRTGKNYRLPSEAEWEYATRAIRSPLIPLNKGGIEKQRVKSEPFYFGETLTTKLANYDGNYTYAEESKGKYREQTTPVEEFPPNAFGLYDLHGNVWEWCLDDWHENYEGVPNDGSAWIDNDNRSHIKCLRGGTWLNNPWLCRSANRSWDKPDDDDLSYGFRVVSVSPGLF